MATRSGVAQLGGTYQSEQFQEECLLGSGEGRHGTVDLLHHVGVSGVLVSVSDLRKSIHQLLLGRSNLTML